MRQVWKPTTPAEMYDRALQYAHDRRLPPDYPKPRPTSEWPPENIALLEQYCEWLRSGGASPAVIRTIYLPMAGHILGLALKPHPQLDLEVDLQRGLDFLRAKQMSAEWTDICRNSMLKFRRFLRHQRGIVEIKVHPFQPELHTEGLPTWLILELTRYQRIQQRNWRQARLQESIRRFWIEHLQVWRFLSEKCQVIDLKDIKRRFILDFVDQQLEKGYAASSINASVRYFHGFLGFLQEEGYAVPQTLLRIPCLKQPEPLPKFLTDEQVKKLRDEFEERVLLAQDFRSRREALLDRASFLLLWQSGLRISEVEELRLEELDLPARRLTVRQSKNMKDRTVFMTDTTVQTIQEYLTVRGPGPTDHVFLYRNQPVSKDLIRGRLKAAGDRVGVKVHPHRLRHTAATQLLNAGCRITSIQKFLGHKELNTTMIYARVHDKTVAEDYYAAMSQVEKRLNLIGYEELICLPIAESTRTQLLELTEALTKPVLNAKSRLKIASQMRHLLNHLDIGLKEYLKISVPAPPELALT
jgi:site-specific recombinase XerD